MPVTLAQWWWFVGVSFNDFYYFAEAELVGVIVAINNADPVGATSSIGKDTCHTSYSLTSSSSFWSPSSLWAWRCCLGFSSWAVAAAQYAEGRCMGLLLLVS